MSSSLRKLYIFRVAFSAIWVALVSSVSSPTTTDATLGVLAGVLLVVYPTSDAVATIFDLRSDYAGQSKLPQRVNLATSSAAAVAVAAAATHSLNTTMHVFAAWAIVSGTIQLLVGASRLRRLNGQWLMIISGAGSIFAGTAFIGSLGGPSFDLHALQQYSIGGAIWYLLTAVWLMWPRNTSTVSVPGGS